MAAVCTEVWSVTARSTAATDQTRTTAANSTRPSAACWTSTSTRGKLGARSPPHTGPCRASHTRWYYDPLNRKCSRFTYGGCNANGNNFEEEDKCSKTCDGVTESNVFFKGIFERYEKDDESDSGHIALAVLLSVAILALLAVLTYCFLKSRKKSSHRAVSTGPAHMPLSGQDTLVYNSTTKPV